MFLPTILTETILAMLQNTGSKNSLPNGSNVEILPMIL
jgi:hypothetical protein